jgi:hypothetical protein
MAIFQKVHIFIAMVIITRALKNMSVAIMTMAIIEHLKALKK